MRRPPLKPPFENPQSLSVFHEVHQVVLEMDATVMMICRVAARSALSVAAVPVTKAEAIDCSTSLDSNKQLFMQA